MTEQELYAYLDSEHIPYETFHHKAVFTVAEGDSVGIPDLGIPTKNLFLRDDKHREYFVVTVHEDKRVDIKALAHRIPSRRLSFASEQDLSDKLGLIAGSVTPFGILNDDTRSVTMIFDEDLAHQRINAHPLVNTATVFVDTDDVARILRDHGNPVVFLDTGEA